MNAIVCRPALPLDTPDVMELTRTIWDGHDYVPLVWEDWLKDPHGLLAIAELRGRVVGAGKLTQLAESQWWLEGLRVDPRFQGQGVASHLHEYQLDVWQRKHGGVIRLATSSARLPVQHLCERTGFHKAAEFATFSAEAIDEPAGAFEPVKAGDIQEAHALIMSSRFLDYSAGLVNIGWQWAAPIPEFMQEPVGLGHAFWWNGRRGLLVAWENPESEDPQLDIQALVASAGGITEVLIDYRKLCAERGQVRAFWRAPLHPLLSRPLRAAGFERESEHSIYIYEKAHSPEPEASMV